VRFGGSSPPLGILFPIPVPFQVLFVIEAYQFHPSLERYFSHIGLDPMEASSYPLRAKQNLVGNLHMEPAYTEEDLRKSFLPLKRRFYLVPVNLTGILATIILSILVLLLCEGALMLLSFLHPAPCFYSV
jgi:hypothetical protein